MEGNQKGKISGRIRKGSRGRTRGRIDEDVRGRIREG